MNISWLTIRDLEYISAVGEHLHFGNAARACNVSQPALSSQIKKMEDMLGFRIFERTNRKVSLTERGRPVVDQARVVLEEAQKLIAVAQVKGSAELAGTLRLGAIATLGPYYIPHLLPLMKSKYPRVQIFLREGLTDGLLAELKNGALDLVLAARTFDETGFKVFAIFEEPFVLAVPRNHPLATKKPVRSADLRGEEMVLLEDGHCLRDQALEICPPNRRGNIRQFHATSLETLRHLVASGMGYTLMPKLSVADNDSLKGMLKYRRLESENIGRTIVLVCRERYARLKEVETLAKFLSENPPL